MSEYEAGCSTGYPPEAHDAPPPQVTRENASEEEVHRWATEASTIGLRPGEWPSQLTTSLGNGLVFELLARGNGYQRYAQRFGNITLCVFND